MAKKLSELMAEPLELKGGRLFKFNLVETEKAKYFLRTTHHISFDRSAANIFFADVAKFYENPAAEITPENYDALDAANEEFKARQSEEFTKAKNWYEKNFGGIDIEALPIPDRDDEKIFFGTFDKIFALDYSTIRNFCRENKISASALTATAFTIVIGTYTHQQESLFSTIYHERNERTKNIVGINDLFSYADLNQICPMKNTPFFAYHGLIKTTGNNFAVELLATAEGMKIHIEYNSARYSGDFVETFAACYENVLRQLMEKIFVKEVELLNEAQKKILTL